MKAILIITLSFISITSFAQEQDVEKYFDDGGLGNLKNAFKIDVLPSAGGDVTFIYERFFSDKWSLEVGGGFLLGHGVNSLLSILDDLPFFYDRSGGYKLVFSGLFHPNKDRLDGVVYGLTGFYRSINDMERYDFVIPSMTQTYVGYYCGKRYELSTTISLEAGLSIGPLFYGDDSFETQTDLFDNADVNFTLSLKLSLHK